jgi:phosphinothricin acetyltransferase
MMMEIRSMSPADWQQVRRIYLEGLATGQATFETEAPSWETWDAHHLPFARLVACASGVVKGWAALSPISARAVYGGVAEVSVYVAQDSRREGVGRALLERLIELSEESDIWTLQASIFPENEASMWLHKSCGFRAVGIRERIARLHGLWRDTVLLERRSKAVGNPEIKARI